MKKSSKILLLNLPNPPYQRLWRDTAGGFGTAVSCSVKDNQTGEASFHPFFPYASSVFLNSGIEFKIIDCQRLKLNESLTLDFVYKENADVIISVLSLPSLAHDKLILNKIKQANPNVVIIGVGTVCSVIPEEVLCDHSIDVVLRNSYPYIHNLVSLFEAIVCSKNIKDVSSISYWEKNSIIHASSDNSFNVDDLPTPCYDFMELDGYETTPDVTGKRHLYLPIIESKGCPYDCVYCPYPLGFGRKIFFRSTKDIVDEIEYLNSAHDIDAFLLRGQTFAIKNKRANEICDELLRRNLDVVWFCESRVDEVNKSLLKIMKKAGCNRIHYGVETGDSNILQTAKSGVVLETTKKAFKITKDLDILSHAHVILGWPNDDRKTMENTRNFMSELAPDFINLNFLTPYPGTKMYEIAKMSSLILTKDWSNYTSHKVVMKTKFLGANELLTFKKQIIRDYAKRNLKQLFQKDLTMNNPQVMMQKAKRLLDKLMFPDD